MKFHFQTSEFLLVCFVFCEIVFFWFAQRRFTVYFRVAGVGGHQVFPKVKIYSLSVWLSVTCIKECNVFSRHLSSAAEIFKTIPPQPFHCSHSAAAIPPQPFRDWKFKLCFRIGWDWLDLIWFDMNSWGLCGIDVWSVMVDIEWSAGLFWESLKIALRRGKNDR